MKNVRIIEPQGAFFLFSNIEETGLDSNQVAKILLEAGSEYLRFSCSLNIDEMREGFNRMEKPPIFR